jgi:hypothetical protein
MATLPTGKTVALPAQTYQPGTHTSPKLSLAVGQSSIEIEAARNSWPDTGSAVVSVVVNISFDAGNTFQLLAGFTAGGGDVINPFTKTLETKSSFGVPIPQPQNANRQVQAIATIFSAINTSVSVTVN